MYPWKGASTVLNHGFRDDGSSRPQCFGLMHLAILPLLVRAEAGWGWDWSHKMMSSGALCCQTITQLWTGQHQTCICFITKLWAKLWAMREQPRPQVLPWFALTPAGCTAWCQVTSQVLGNVQVHEMFDSRDVFRKMWTPRWRSGAGLNCVEQHVSCVTSTIFKLVTAKRLQVLIIKQIRLWVVFFNAPCDVSNGILCFRLPW